MKNLIFATTLLIAAAAFAGPEDHVQAQVCYAVQSKDLAYATPELPTELCFEKVEIAVGPAHTVDKIAVYSYFDAYQKHFNKLKLTQLIRATEDEYSFTAVGTLAYRPEAHCEEGLQILLVMKGRTNFLGQAELGTQEITLSQVKMAQTCSTRFERQDFKLIRIR